MRLALIVVLFASCLARADDSPRLRDLRTQTVGGVTYFRARFDRPADLWLPTVPTRAAAVGRCSSRKCCARCAANASIVPIG